MKVANVIKTNRLLPCPFCGKAAELTDYYGSDYQVWCPYCYITPIGVFSKTIQGAIDKWNTRNGILLEVKE